MVIGGAPKIKFQYFGKEIIFFYQEIDSIDVLL